MGEDKQDDIALVIHGNELPTTTATDEETTPDKSKGQSKREWLINFFIKNFLPIVLIFAVVFGALVPAPGVFFNHKATVYVCVSILFFYVGLYLRTSAVKDAMKAYKAYIWAVLSILVFTCIIGGQLTNLLTFDPLEIDGRPTKLSTTGNATTNMTSTIPADTAVPRDSQGGNLGPFECKVGLIMYLIMPCTVGSGVIMIMSMKANVALGIMICCFCNVIGIFTIPLYLKWLVYSNVNVNFDIAKMMLKLFLTLFIPLAVGKILRINNKIRGFITVRSHKIALKMFALSALAFILLIKTSKSSHDGSLKLITGTTALFICSWALATHVLFLMLNTAAAFMLKLPLPQKKCVIILASQKTLSQAVAATVFLPDGVGDQGLIAVTMVFCHITVLVFDSILIPIWMHLEGVYENRKKLKNGGEDHLVAAQE